MLKLKYRKIQWIKCEGCKRNDIPSDTPPTKVAGEMFKLCPRCKWRTEVVTKYEQMKAKTVEQH